MNTVASNIFSDFVSLFFPRFCAGCHEALVKGEELICTKCILEIPRTNYHLDKENAFFRKLVGRIKVQYVVSFFKFSKGGRVQRILHQLKYRNKPELGRKLGYVFGKELEHAGYGSAFDVIIPIPLHPGKKKLRGFNQSEEFGIGLGQALQIHCTEAYLSRRVLTGTQTKRSRSGRWSNVKDAFHVESPSAIQNKRVLLVDDVVTTGATLEAAGRALLNAGCSELSIACIAATQ